MSENREVKSDVFSMLMENKVYALEVYNALKGSDYTDPELVEIQELERFISLSMRNDASFIVDMNLEIYEHQSTHDPNMPLRSLIYVAGILRKNISTTDLLSRKRIMIPTPHFVVFYNGQANRPAMETLRLSDSYENNDEEPMLELVCTVININTGKNDEFLEKCSVLSQYTQFIDKVREFECLNFEEPIKEAIKWCIENGILVEFLKDRGQEVIKAMTIDMTWERREQLIRRDEREAGREEGREMLLVEMVINALKNKHTPEEIAQFMGIEQDTVFKIQNEYMKL